MERTAKRKREATLDDSQRPVRFKEEEAEERTGWHSLPIEIAQMILDTATRQHTATHIVCGFVSTMEEYPATPPPSEKHDFACSVANEGYLSVLQWGRLNGCTWNEIDILQGATLHGHLEVLKWLRSISEGSNWGNRVCNSATLGGHLEVLKWAVANGCGFDESTCAFAAKGELPLVKWLREKGCPWNELCCEFAAACGNFEVLKWAVEKKCPCKPGVCWNEARKNGHQQMADWIEHNYCAHY